MDIVSCSDNNYVMPLAVAMTSVMANTQGEVCYHIISDGIGGENKRKLQECAAKSGQSVCFYDIPHSLLERLPVRKSGYLSVAAYIRLFVADILPKDLDKVLYLDCDIVAKASLDELWQTDISEYSAAVVADSIADDSFFERLGYDKSYHYFNSGLMLINIDYWRRHGVQQMCLDFIGKHPGKIVCEDQDVLNAVLYKSTLYLPIRYNAVCTVFYRQPQFAPEWQQQVEEAVKSPVIVHFTYIKPWFHECDHPLSGLFFKYQALTPWKGTPLRYFHKGKAKYKYVLKKFLVKLGWRSQAESAYIKI